MLNMNPNLSTFRKVLDKPNTVLQVNRSAGRVKTQVGKSIMPSDVSLDIVNISCPRPERDGLSPTCEQVCWWLAAAAAAGGGCL